MHEMQMMDMEEYSAAMEVIPPAFMADLDAYVSRGVRTKLVDAVMSNDLFGFCMGIGAEEMVDADIIHALYLYTLNVPARCFGSMGKVVAWSEVGGEIGTFKEDV